MKESSVHVMRRCCLDHAEVRLSAERGLELQAPKASRAARQGSSAQRRGLAEPTPCSAADSLSVANASLELRQIHNFIDHMGPCVVLI